MKILEKVESWLIERVLKKCHELDIENNCAYMRGDIGFKEFITTARKIDRIKRKARRHDK